MTTPATAETPASHAPRSSSRAGRWWGVAAIALVATLGGYAVWAAVQWNRQPAMDYDALTELRRVLPPVAPGSEAWPHYRQALKPWHTAVVPAEDEGRWTAWRRLTGGLLPESTPEERAASMAFVAAHADLVAPIREAALMPELGFVPALELQPEDAAYFADDETMHLWADRSSAVKSYAVKLPYLGELAAAARLLQADACLAAAAGDGDRAVADLEAALRIACHLHAMPTLVDSLVAQSIQGNTARTIVQVLDTDAHRLGSEHLAALAAVLAQHPVEATHLNLIGESIASRDLLQHCFAADGSYLPGRTTQLVEDLTTPAAPNATARRPGPWDMLVAPWHAPGAGTRHQAQMTWDSITREIEEQSRLPAYRQSFTVWQDLLDGGNARDDVLDPMFPVRCMAPSLPGGAKAASSARDFLAAARLRVALERYRREHGRWPASLDELVPGALTVLPLREKDGKPFPWSATDAGVSIFVDTEPGAPAAE